MKLRLEVITDSKEAGALGKEIKALEGGGHPVLNELSLSVFRGAPLYVLRGPTGLPVSLNVSYFGKRRKNIFEPYMNWLIAYTLPAYRRQGLATRLYKETEQEALNRGCRRVRSLAGSSAGAALHLSLGHSFWGMKDTGELFVDSHLYGLAYLYEDKQAPGGVPLDHPLSIAAVKGFIKEGLRYDRG